MSLFAVRSLVYPVRSRHEASSSAGIIQPVGSISPNSNRIDHFICHIFQQILAGVWMIILAEQAPTPRRTLLENPR